MTIDSYTATVAIIREALSGFDDGQRDLVVIRPSDGDRGWVIHLEASRDVDAEAQRLADVLGLPLVEEQPPGFPAPASLAYGG